MARLRLHALIVALLLYHLRDVRLVQGAELDHQLLLFLTCTNHVHWYLGGYVRRTEPKQALKPY